MDNSVVIVGSLVFGAICAAIATGKGRSGVGWFFVGFFAGCIGLIIVLCMSDLKEEEQHRRRSRREHRRLREQLHQERLKNESFQNHVQGRLDVHDDALGLDTRSLENQSSSPGRLLDGARRSDTVPALPPGGALDNITGRTWYAQVGDESSKPLSFTELRELFQRRDIDERSLVWTEGMDDWLPLGRVHGLREEMA